MAGALLSIKAGGPRASLRPCPTSPLPTVGALSNRGGRKADGYQIHCDWGRATYLCPLGLPPPRIFGASSASCLSHTPQTQRPLQSINMQCYSMTLEGTALCLAMQKHLSSYKQTPTKTHGEEQLESKYAPMSWDHFTSHYIWFFKCWFLLYL